MFRFAHPLYLYLLLLIPLFTAVFVFVRYQRKRNLRKFGDMELIRQLMPDVSSARPVIKFVLLMTALMLIVFILARPQYGMRNEEFKRKGIEAIITVDVSNSMLCWSKYGWCGEKSRVLVKFIPLQFRQWRGLCCWGVYMG